MKLTIIGNGYDQPIYGMDFKGERIEIDRKIFYGMAVRDVERRLKDISHSRLEVLSTGRAWIEHIPVSLFLSGKADIITFCLPDRYDLHAGAFTIEGRGPIANLEHRQMAEIVQAITVTGVSRCMAKGWISDEQLAIVHAAERERNCPKQDMSFRQASASIIFNEIELANRLAACDAMFCYGYGKPSGFAALVWKRFHTSSSSSGPRTGTSAGLDPVSRTGTSSSRTVKHFIDLRKMQIDIMHKMGAIHKKTINYANLRNTGMMGGPPQKSS